MPQLRGYLEQVYSLIGCPLTALSHIELSHYYQSNYLIYSGAPWKGAVSQRVRNPPG